MIPSIEPSVSGRRGSGTSSVDRTKSATLGGRGSAKSRTRSKSPFRSFRWPKSKSPKSEGQSGRDAYSDDEDNVHRSTFGKSLFQHMLIMKGVMTYELVVRKNS